MNYKEQLISMLETSYSPFHAVKNIVSSLKDAGFEELRESSEFSLQKGHSYYVVRNGTAVIAFKVPSVIGNPMCKIAAVHTDSPTFKIKPNPIKRFKNIVSLNCEPYGGGIYYSFFDKPLSLAGRVFVKKDGKVSPELIAIDKDLLYIPSVCIHMNRQCNSGYEFNAARDTIPMMGDLPADFSFNAYLSSLVGGEVVSYDLFIYNRQKPTVVGFNGEYLSSPRLDDLSADYTVLMGFIESKPKELSLFAAFDNEEVGSLTKQGANSDFMKHTIGRIYNALGFSKEERFAALSKSFLLSVDNAHANHPNRPDLSDSTTDVRLNGGIVLKYNANQTYTSDGLSSSIVKELCSSAGVKFQEYTNRSDLRGGGTLGNISNAEVSLTAADVGIAQLAMHSANEIMGIDDTDAMVALSRELYNRTIDIEGESFSIK